MQKKAEWQKEREAQLLLSYGIHISMYSKGRALDSIFTEGFWRTIKYQEVYLKNYASPREPRDELAHYCVFKLYDGPLGPRSSYSSRNLFHSVCSIPVRLGRAKREKGTYSNGQQLVVQLDTFPHF